jgi:hypothetical protein
MGILDANNRDKKQEREPTALELIAKADAERRHAEDIAKGSPDQPRDPLGRWAAGAGVPDAAGFVEPIGNTLPPLKYADGAGHGANIHGQAARLPG